MQIFRKAIPRNIGIVRMTTMIQSVVVFLLVAVCVAASPLQLTLEQRYAKFDALVEQRNVDKAKLVIEDAHELDPSRYEALFRMARLHVLLGDRETNEDRQLAFYEEAVGYANDAIRANGKGMAGYVYRAAANGKVALFKGIFSVGDVVTSVRDDAWYAIHLNNEGAERLAAAHYILGRAHLALSYKPGWVRGPLGLGWGDLGEAHTHLKKARELRPGFIMFELEYARCLAEMDEEGAAIRIARSIASMKLQEPGDDKRKREAEELIEEL